MSVIVYVLTNQAMPNLVKIGKTSRRDPRVRMKNLYSTGVPLPFECAIAVELEDQQGTKLESALHVAFSRHRLNPSREFFEIEAYEVEAILRTFPGRDVTPKIKKEINEEIDALDANSREASRKYKKKRGANFDLHKMGIPNKSILVSTQTQEKATVTGAQLVSFRNKKLSLTNATKLVLKVNYSFRPISYWLFNGRNLKDIYNDRF